MYSCRVTSIKGIFIFGNKTFVLIYPISRSKFYFSLEGDSSSNYIYILVFVRQHPFDTKETGHIHSQLSCDTACALTLESYRGHGHFQLLLIYSRALHINILLRRINPSLGQVFVWDHHL